VRIVATILHFGSLGVLSLCSAIYLRGVSRIAALTFSGIIVVVGLHVLLRKQAVKSEGDSAPVTRSHVTNQRAVLTCTVTKERDE
jgi:hypothetical protein